MKVKLKLSAKFFFLFALRMWSRIAQFSSLVFLLLCVSGNHKISALKFDLAGATDENQLTCIGQYIPKDLMVAVEVILGEGFQQTVDLVVSDYIVQPTRLQSCSKIQRSLLNNSKKTFLKVRDRNGGNQYYKKKNLKSGELKFAFTSHEWTDVEFCFSNLLDQGKSGREGAVESAKK